MCATDAYTHQHQGGGERGNPSAPVPLYMKPWTVENQKCSDNRKYLVFMGVWLGSQIHVTHLLLHKNYLLLLDAIRLGQTFPSP